MSAKDIIIYIPLSAAQQLKDFALYWDERRSIDNNYTHGNTDKPYATSYLGLVQSFLKKRRDNGTPYIKARAYGDISLLTASSHIENVRMSRSITKDMFFNEHERLMSECKKEKTTIISPFRSWSEKEILKACRLNELPHIIIYGGAMQQLWHPSNEDYATHHQMMPDWYMASELYNQLHSVDFHDKEQCDKGQTLFLALWPDKPDSMPVGKAECEIMNEVSKHISQSINASLAYRKP